MKRPFEVTFLGGLFVVVGLASMVYHLWTGPLDRWTILIAAIGVVALIAGVFLLLGRNWARWLLLAWLAFHIAVSAFHSMSDALAHAALLAVVGYFLLWAKAAKYFQSARAE